MLGNGYLQSVKTFQVFDYTGSACIREAEDGLYEIVLVIGILDGTIPIGGYESYELAQEALNTFSDSFLTAMVVGQYRRESINHESEK